uniref:Molybdopterin synthase catalytic subunit n=1 Tax=Mucochytrium quahogii TaxID=96639 RepID=A0A7S2WIL5_9STRA|mmetsp:Transcript_4658/g.6987  ORF Transcript_4658/g.6987 Transcript_4658/m.6987 type:complete len:188 (+) Transcript_4658:92-655(+)
MHGRQSFEYACLVASGFMLCKLVDKVVKWGKARAPDASTHVEITHVKVKQGELDIGELVDMVKSPFAGAIATFSGTTRNNFEDKTVTHLEYEGYVPMAEKQLKLICDEIRAKWQDIISIAIEHKLGSCPILDTSVIIAISSAHRAAALEATAFAIDSLKATVPIWKKELYAGSCPPKWKENTEFVKR